MTTMRYYIPKHFSARDFVPPELFRLRGDAALPELMDSRILWTVDALAECPLFPRQPGQQVATITINDYARGGNRSQSGYRTDEKLLRDAPCTQHRSGRAVDMLIAGVTADEFRALARSGKLARELQYVTRIEDGVGWIHVDCANVAGSDLVFFSKRKEIK
jgi:hypothetical protein